MELTEIIIKKDGKWYFGQANVSAQHPQYSGQEY